MRLKGRGEEVSDCSGDESRMNKQMICSVSFGAHAGNWKVRVTLLPFRVRAHPLPRIAEVWLVPRIADHSGRTIDIYPNYTQI